MAILSATERAAIRNDLLAIIGDRDVSVCIRRGNTTLAPQIVRIERSGRAAQWRQNDSAEEHRTDIVLHGVPGTDVLQDDRFVVDGALYRVVFLHPNRDVMVQASCELVDGPSAVRTSPMTAEG